MKRSVVTLSSMVVVALTTAAVAFAGNGAVLQTYGGKGGNAQTKVDVGATAPLSSSKPSSGTLPFTGLDLGIALAVALGLVALGIVLRRSGRQSGNS